MFQIPTDLFQLFIVTGILTSRFATLTAAMHLLIFTLLTIIYLGMAVGEAEH